MCCILTVLALVGPRAAIVVWWLADPSRWDRAFSTFVWPLVGFIFAPWTTLAYVVVQPGGVNGFDWVWIVLALLVDISMNSGSAYRNRKRVYVYSSRYPAS